MIQWRMRGPDLIVEARGDLDLEQADSFRQEFDAAIDANAGARRVVLCLDRVSFIDSSGLGVVFGRHRRLVSRGVQLVIAGPNQHVRRALDLVGASSLIPVYESREKALAAQAEVGK